MVHPTRLSYLVLAVALLGTGGCGTRKPAAASRGTATLYAARNTRDAVNDLARKFQEERGIAVQTHFDGSSALAQQIAEGAEADLFLSGSERWADFLDEQGLVAERRPLMGDRLVVIAPAKSALRLEELEDLLTDDVGTVALGNPERVPAGRYAKEALIERELWRQLKPKVKLGVDGNQVFAFLEQGEADVAVAFLNDVARRSGFRELLYVDVDLAQRRSPLVLLKQGTSNAAARALYEYMAGEPAAEVFRAYGFVVSGESASAASRLARQRPEPRKPWVQLRPEDWSAVRLSFQVATCAVLANLPFAIAIGYVLARRQFVGKWVVEAVVSLPLVLPPVVTGFVLLYLLGTREGVFGSFLYETFGIRFTFDWKGAAVAAAVMSFPLMVRAIRLAFQAVDPRLVLAARSLGASRLSSFFTVTLPLARPGLIAGCMLGFARSLGEFGATITLASNVAGETQTIPLLIFKDTQNPDRWAHVWTLAALSALLACGAVAISEILERRQARREST